MFPAPWLFVHDVARYHIAVPECIFSQIHPYQDFTASWPRAVQQGRIHSIFSLFD